MGIKHVDGDFKFDSPADRAFGFHDHGGAKPRGTRGRASEPNADHEMMEEGHARGGEHHAHGGAHHMHPHGHDGARGHHPHPEGDGHMMHHSHGGYTHHHADGTTTHHDARGGHIAHHAMGGQHPDGHHPGEGTYLARGGRHADPDAAEDKAMIKKAVGQHEDHEHGGEHTDLHLARGGHRPGLMRSMRPKVARMHTEMGGEKAPVNRPPRPPRTSPTPPNEMPGDTMGMGVQPSTEPDMAGSGQGIPQLARGGRHRGHKGGHGTY